MKIALFSLFLLVCLACNQSSDKDAKSGAGNEKPLVLSTNSSAFNQSFAALLTAYLQLKDQLVAEQDSGIAQATRALILASDSLKLSELKVEADLRQTAFSYSDGISSEAQGLLGENNLLSKRRSFQMISDQLHDLIRTVQYNQKTLYRFYCDKAFEDQGAYWISDQTGISNPYLPKTKEPCSVLKDTLSFSSN